MYVNTSNTRSAILAGAARRSAARSRALSRIASIARRPLVSRLAAGLSKRSAAKAALLYNRASKMTANPIAKASLSRAARASVARSVRAGIENRVRQASRLARLAKSKASSAMRESYRPPVRPYVERYTGPSTSPKRISGYDGNSATHKKARENFQFTIPTAMWYTGGVVPNDDKEKENKTTSAYLNRYYKVNEDEDDIPFYIEHSTLIDNVLTVLVILILIVVCLAIYHYSGSSSSYSSIGNRSMSMDDD